MTSLAVGGALFFCCAYVGFGFAAYYRRRLDLLAALAEYAGALETGIAYLKQPLPDITEGFREGRRGDAGKLLAGYSRILSGGSRTEEECRAVVPSILLSGYERRIVSEFLASLGRTDADTQIGELKKYGALFAHMRDEAKTQNDKIGKTAAKLGVLAGIAAMLAAV